MERVKTPQEEHREAMTILAWLCLILLAGAVWVASHGLLLRLPQVIALLVCPCLPIFYLIVVVRYRIQLSQVLAKQWPRPRLYVSRTHDRKSVGEAIRLGVTFLGYENDGSPVYWTDDQRSMQANLPGITGSGKTTLLLNIVDQDIRRGRPVVYFDGKGEKGLVLKIWNMAFAAGRGADVRVIDPTHPNISKKFNPFYAADGKLQQRVGAVFDSLGAARAKDEFFSEHQRAFLNAVTVILEHTGKHFTFWDVLVACQKPELMNRLIENFREQVMSNPDIPQHQKNAFLLAAATLKGNYEDKDWLSKIRGLLNSMMPFAGESLALITGSCENLVTFEEVVEKKQILIVSMNLGTDSQPYRALGRILMRNLQFMISSRYNEYRMDQEHPFISIVLDEFGLYSYQGFKDIIHTARQANASFIFSFQSIQQLAMDVSDAFASDVASAPNTKFMMKISNENTAETFLKASARVPTQQLSVRVEKGNFLDSTPYVEEGTGTRQEVFDTRVKDHQVKMLPIGQMMALLPDKQMGVIVKHIHIPRGNHAALSTLPEWLPILKTPLADSLALDLRLDEAETTTSNKSVYPKRRRTNASTQTSGGSVRALYGRSDRNGPTSADTAPSSTS
jgi:hypothetical protein